MAVCTGALVLGRSEASDADSFLKIRQQINAKAKSGEWKKVTRKVGSATPGHEEIVVGYLEANVLQKLVHIESWGEGNEAISLYFWQDGQLVSLYQLLKGEATEMSEIGEAEETYNFAQGKLVGWIRVPGGEVPASDFEGTGIGDQWLDHSVRLAQHIYDAVGAD